MFVPKARLSLVRGIKPARERKGKFRARNYPLAFLRRKIFCYFCEPENGAQALILARKRKMMMLSNADKLARWMKVGLRAQLSPRFSLTEMWRERCTKLYSSTQSKSDFSRRNFARFNLRFQCEFVNGALNLFLIAFSV